MSKFNEIYLRTVAKSVSWRVVITLTQIVNTLIVTGNLVLGFKIAGLSAAVNIILYWVHERVWNKIQWNRQQLGSTFKEGWTRSIGKDISWRVLQIINNFWMPFVLTGSWKIGLSFMTVATLINMFIYWSHERLWNLVPYGKQVVEEEQNTQV